MLFAVQGFIKNFNTEARIPKNWHSGNALVVVISSPSSTSSTGTAAPIEAPASTFLIPPAGRPLLVLTLMVVWPRRRSAAAVVLFTSLVRTLGARSRRASESGTAAEAGKSVLKLWTTEVVREPLSRSPAIIPAIVITAIHHVARHLFVHRWWASSTASSTVRHVMYILFIIHRRSAAPTTCMPLRGSST